MISMTGYGQSTIEENNLKIKVEMKSFNHRFLEVMIRMPRQLLHLEDQLKKVIQNQIHRGKVDVFISIEGNGLIKKNVHIDWELLDSYLVIASKIKERTSVSSELKVEDLLFHEQLVTIEEEVEPNEHLSTVLLTATEQATRELVSMRKNEGDALQKDLKNRIDKIQSQVRELKKYAPSVVNYYRDRLNKRVEEFLHGTLEIDENRILTEVAIFADKSNIDEELTRLESHLEQFLLTMQDGIVIGRKLDFLVQEMNREANTIGSKANDIQISRQIVELKSEIEKIKEQVQNIE